MKIAFVPTTTSTFLTLFGTHKTLQSRSVLKCEQPSVNVVRMSAGSRSVRPAVNVARNYVTRDRTGLPVLNIDGFSRPPPPYWLFALIVAAVGWLLRRLVIARHLARVYKRVDLSQDIAEFYDARSAAWERVWGEHMHHGIYDKVDGKTLKGREAQVRTMSELLHFGGLLNEKLPPGARVLDVGCGIGGASRYLAEHFGEGCRVTGITLSPYQAKRATELNEERGLGGRVTNEVRNALKTGFPDDHFDVVWSLESGEHMENKQQFLQECARVLKPGGKMVMLAWCIRETSPPLRMAERFSIRRIMEEYCLPRVVPPSEYDTEMVRAGLRAVDLNDWTKRAAPFWGEVVRSALFRRSGWEVLLKYKWPLIRSALAMRHVIRGIKQGVFRIVAFSAHKPTEREAREEKERTVACCSKSSLPLTR